MLPGIAHQLVAGVYDVVHDGRDRIYCTVASVCVDQHCPPLLAGVAVGPTRTDDVGRQMSYTVSTYEWTLPVEACQGQPGKLFGATFTPADDIVFTAATRLPAPHDRIERTSPTCRPVLTDAPDAHGDRSLLVAHLSRRARTDGHTYLVTISSDHVRATTRDFHDLMPTGRGWVGVPARYRTTRLHGAVTVLVRAVDAQHAIAVCHEQIHRPRWWSQRGFTHTSPDADTGSPESVRVLPYSHRVERVEHVYAPAATTTPVLHSHTLRHPQAPH
ncbi:hypothetical protein [Pseudonocardia parietis]|uniref:Acetoacetate decarboxylase n=1 Tax=Pseudonocardia parietis TaxID=570936 RepID=A0ABS4W680_9PSEU|nr:hypothetical protein [Pseudonocardia parietis]MBP2371680.1 hypothetical protein [Pseudonocardia parietis]